MIKYRDSLRGYGRAIFERDNFTCAYCGTKHNTFTLWRFLTVDHLLPPGHPDREDPRWQVTACSFCNTAKNRTKYHIDENTSPEDIIKEKKKKIEETTREYLKFWQEHYES